MGVSENLNSIKNTTPQHIKIVAVSKTKPVSVLQEAYEAGQRIFGENKVQELQEKHEVLPKDIEWHMIGHLQTNKVKYIAPFVSLIHAVDSLKLLKEINKQALKNNRKISVLIQFHIAKEESKFGLSKDKAVKILTDPEFTSLKNIVVKGVMGMATHTSNVDQIAKEFCQLESIFQDLKNTLFNKAHQFTEISMGMSSDFKIAIKHGSTMIRVGSLIFGNRNYEKK